MKKIDGRSRAAREAKKEAEDNCAAVDPLSMVAQVERINEKLWRVEEALDEVLRQLKA